MTRVRRRVAVALVVAGAVSAVLAGCGSAGDELGSSPVDRVLVVSLPGLGWDDLRSTDLPNLAAFVETAAIGDVSTRIGRHNAGTTEAYLTLGAGTRAVVPELDMAVAVEPDESYQGIPAAELIERRLGSVRDGITYLAIGAAIDANDDSIFGADVGTLGDHLADAGVDRAVIANADAGEGFVSNEPLPDGVYARGAATALMGSDGVVPGGVVDRSLLADDQDAPFGRRLDPDAVIGAFDRAWGGGSRQVVLVEASDLSRAAAYAGRSSAPQRRALRTEALEDSDALLGELLARVDPGQDAVIVLSPVSPASSPALGIAAVRAPAIETGLLKSATTRRDGYVQLADVAPTVLSLLGEEPPDEIEGRTFQVAGGPRPGRVERLADAADAAEDRDAMMPAVVVAICLLLAALALATVLRARLERRARGLLVPVAFAALGLVPATFLVGRLDVLRGSTFGYVVVLVATAAAIGAAVTLAERRRPGLGALLGLGLIVALIASDLPLGATLQVNTTFGYSVGVAGRFAGVGNLAFALFGSATIVLAALLVDRAGQQAVPAAVVLLAFVVAVEGLPMLGADVGGVLSMVPAFGVTALVLAGRRVGPREVVALVVATAVAIIGFAFIDAARPPEVHTHLARLAEHIVDGRWGMFFRSLTRRWQASLGGAELAGWLTVASVLVAAGAYVTLVATGRAGPDVRDRRRHRPTMAAAAGVGVLGLVGLVANDSSVAVPLTMLIVVVPVIVVRALGAVPVGPLGGDTSGGRR